MNNRILVVCTTDSMIWNFLVPHIKELENKGYYVECASSVTGCFFEDLKALCGIKMNEIPFERSPYRLVNIKAYRMLCSLIKQKGFDTVFCHEPVGGAIGRLAGRKCGCKVIYMAHGFHFFNGAPKSRIIYYLVEKFLSRITDVLLTINEEDYEKSLKFYAKKNIKINGIGVDTKKFTKEVAYKNYLKDEFALPREAITIVSVGELITRKNHSAIIRALGTLNNPNFFYFIAGDGELREELSFLIKELKLDNNVFLLGYRKDVSRLCNSADIFALPSIHEGLSVALMEAMGCGKPIIGSRIRGNVDLIEVNKGGFLCSTYDSDSYAKSIMLLAESEELRTTMGEYNMNKVKEFDIVRVKEELIKALI